MADNLLDVEPRIYQQIIFSEVVSNPGNTLVVLPTGLGKTVIMAYLTAYHLNKSSSIQVLILTPTRPLVRQIKEVLVEVIPNLSDEMVLEISGDVPPSKREPMYPSARVIVATPQTIENDLTFGRITFERIGLLCVDEVHRATGDYAYVGIAAQATCQVVGFTATPGNNTEKILEVCNNLKISKVSVTDASDLDVNQYISIHTPKVVWISLPPEYEGILNGLQVFQDELIAELKKGVPGILTKRYVGKREALDIHQRVIKLTKQDQAYGNLLLVSSNLIRVQHLKELVESQGFPQAIKAIQKWRHKHASKALRLFLEDSRTRNIERTMKESALVHPKLKLLIKEIQAALRVDKVNESKIIVFSNYRDTVRFLDEELSKTDIKIGIFLGHASTRGDKGLSQKKQLQVLEEFKNGDTQVLVSTSVGEEGLDVGNCDLVVFYDSVPSVVRAIQRQGRGRMKESRVIHLVTKKTRDEAMYWAIKQKDRLMKTFLRKELPELLEKTVTHKPQSTLDAFFSEETEESSARKPVEGPLIIVDSRETRDQIPRLLRKEGARIQQERLEVGDYLLSNRVVVELKTYSDFIRSVHDGRLFQPSSPGRESQLIRLAQQKVPLLVVQLEPEGIIPYGSLNSIMGAISSIILDFRIPIIFTLSPSETTALLLQLAKREQEKKITEIALPSAGKKTHSIKEIQLFILSTIPGVNHTKAKNLLERFSSIQAISSAEINDLIVVPQIGEKLAKRIQAILNSPDDHEIP